MPATTVDRLVQAHLGVTGRSRTPARLGAIATVTVVALVLLFGALAVATATARGALRVIGHDAGPQVIATADLYLALSDADAQVADVLLMGDEHADLRRAALDRYAQRRADVGTALLQAHALAADSPAERRTIRSVLDGWGRYEQLAARALLLAEQAGYPAGAPPAHVREAYREATDVMSYEVLPQAYNLTLENGTTVRRTHDDARATVLAGRTVVAAGGVLALGCLVWLQIYLVWRFRRVFGPALLVASAVALMYAYTGVTVLGVEADALRTAKQDGFDAVLSLARARAVGNSMHADQVRYLIDPERADTYEQIYLDKAQSLVYVEAGNVATYHAELAALVDTGAPQAPGLLGAPISDPTAGEDDAAAAWAAYDALQQADGELRAAAVAGVGAAAVEVRLGPLRTAFEAHDAALDRLTGRHRERFEAAIAGGEDALADLGFLLPVAMISIAVLVVAGVAPRFVEYR